MLLVVFPSTLVIAEEPRVKQRTPDDRMLQSSARAPREIRTPIDFRGAIDTSEHSTLLSDLPLTGLRGKETPSSPKSGRYCENAFSRSGFPNCIGLFAKTSTDSAHQVGYVGGGTWFGGERRRTNEGTFGMDYSGSWFSRLTWMQWSHGDRHQGGAGRYETEGPRLLPE